MKKLRNNFGILSIIFLIILIVILPKVAFDGALYGLNLWFNQVLPALLPFMICSQILILLNFTKYIQKIFQPITKALFNVSGSGIFPLSMGFLSGYPIGPKITSELRNNKIINNIEGQKILSFCSTSGPIFIISVVCLSMYNDPSLSQILLFSNYLGAILNGILYKYIYFEKDINVNPIVYKNKNFSSALNESIENSAKAIINIGCYIIFFSVIINILNSIGIIKACSYFIYNNFNLFNLSKDLINGCIYGFFEITNGIYKISLSNDPLIIKLSFTSFILAWSGMSILLQANLFIYQTDLKFSIYVISKLTQAIFSFVITFLLYDLIYTNSQAVFSNTIINNNINYNSNKITFLMILSILIIYILNNKKIKKRTYF